MTERAGSVPPSIAAAMATVGFAALAIAGLGVTSVLLDADVIAVPGLGNLPGAAGMVCAVIAVGATVWFGARRRRPSYLTSAATTVGALVAYLLGVVFGGILTGVDPARTVSAAAGFATSWFAVVLMIAAFVAGWSGIALVRTGATRPDWPWERPDSDDE